MSGAIHVNRWAGYLRDMLRVLRPGGWCQLVELHHNAQSDNGSLTEGKFSSQVLCKDIVSDQTKQQPMLLDSGVLGTMRA